MLLTLQEVAQNVSMYYFMNFKHYCGPKTCFYLTHTHRYCKRYCFQQVNEKEEIKTAGKVWNNEYFAGFQNENVKEKSKADVKSFFSNYSAFRP